MLLFQSTAASGTLPRVYPRSPPRPGIRPDQSLLA